MKQQTAALQAAQAKMNFGYGSKSYTVDGVTHRVTGQPLTLCGSAARAAAAGAAVTTNEKHLQKTMRGLEKYNSSKTSYAETLARYKTLPDTAFDDNWILGNGGLTQKQAGLATEWIKTLTNPVPAPKLTPKRAATAAGQAYNRKRKILNSHLQLSQQALVALENDKLMTVPVANEIKDKWAKINPDKKIPSENGKVSPLTVLRTEINYRYASKQWTDRLADLTPRAAEVELLAMKAIEMHMAFKQYQLDRYRAAMQAIQLADASRKREGSALNRARVLANGINNPPKQPNSGTGDTHG